MSKKLSIDGHALSSSLNFRGAAEQFKFYRNTIRRRRRTATAVRQAVESLEARRLLSVTPQVVFPTRQYAAGNGPNAIATADFNGDGRSDIVIADSGTDSLTVLTSSANGSFSSSSYSLAGTPEAIAIGDINGDGKADLVVVTQTSYGGSAANNVSILLGNGSGTFAAATNYDLSYPPTSVALADFNGDGHLDVVAACGPLVRVLLNNGSGVLGSPQIATVPNGGEADQIAIGNIAGNNRPDVVVADEVSNTIYVFPDQSNGHLNAGTAYPLNSYIGGLSVADVTGDGKVDVVTASAVLPGTGSGLGSAISAGLLGSYPFALGDFNGDGHADLAAAATNNGGQFVQLNNGSGTFQAPTQWFGDSVQQSIAAIATGDFNGDGKLDVVTADPSNNTVSIHLGEGNGLLAPTAQRVAMGALPAGLVSADFNGDGHLDLATANASSNSVTVLFNNGLGSFPTSATYSVGDDPRAILAGDFNGDGKLDLAVANYDDNTVSILMNLGNGQFAPAVSYTVGQKPIALAVGDFNGDSKADLVVADFGSPSVNVLMNNGSGTFASAVSYTVNDNPSSVAVGDFNGDSHADIVVSTYAGQNVEVLTNNGSGAFGSATSYSLGTGVEALVAGDFNGDGKSDIAVALATGGVDVMLAKVGGFNAPTNVFTGTAVGLAIGDVSGDSKLDLVVSEGNYSYTGVVAVLIGTGSGAFSSPVEYANGTGARTAPVIGDFNGDSKADIAIATGTYGAGGISLFLGRGGGVLNAPALYHGTGVNPSSIATGDINGDSKLDLVVADYQDSMVSVFLNNGNGSFAAPQTYSVGQGPAGVAVGDFNHDGKLDIAVANYLDDTVSVLINNGSGFNAAQTFSVGTGPKSIVVSDFNHDNYSDIAVGDLASSDITVLTNNQSGGFSSATYTLTSAPTQIAGGDLNGDGFTDLLADSTAGNKIFTLLNAGTGIFGTPASYTSTDTITGPLIVGDLNGDGHSDVLVGSYDSASYSSTVSIFLAKSNGLLNTASTVAVPSNSTLQLADLNGNGKLDLITPSSSNPDDVAVLLGAGDGTFSAPMNFDVGVTPSKIVAGDFDGDGKLDLAISQYSYFNPAVAIAFGNGSGNLLTPSSFGLDESVVSLISGKFNNDSLPDLLTLNNVASDGAATYSVLLNSNGSFYASQNFSLSGEATAVAAGDFNGDGNTDLAFIVPGGTDTLLVLLSNGDGTFQSPMSYSAGTGTDPDAIAVGDFNGDAHPDLAVANYGSGNVTILINNGTGGFTVGSTLTVGANPTSIVAADFNKDGKPDLAVANKGSDNVSILLNTGSGTFASAVNVSVADSPTDLVVADFNSDSTLDLAVIGDNATSGGSDAEVYVLLGTAPTTFTAPAGYLLDSPASSLSVGDFNVDAHPDLVVSSYAGDDVQVLFGNGSGAFAAPEDYSVGSSPNKVLVADFNADSIPDVAAASYTGVSVLTNQFDGIAPFILANTFGPPADNATSLNFSITVADNAQLNLSSLQTGSVTVTLPDGTTVVPTMVSVTPIDSKTALVSFTLSNSFSQAGQYVLNLAASGVLDATGNAAPAGKLSSFWWGVDISVPPSATLLPVTLPNPGQISMQFTVNYTDAVVGVDSSTLSDSNITITNSAISFTGNATVVSSTPTADGVSVVYQIVAPAGAFTFADDGVYQISLNGNSVASSAGTFMPAQSLGSFTVALVDPVVDTTPPTGTPSGFTTPSVGSSSMTFTVTYTDDVAVDGNSITSNTLSITLPDGSTVNPTIVSMSGSGPAITVTYSFSPADGFFDVADNGQYTLNLLSGGFTDMAGNPAAAATLGSFTFNDIPPTASVTSVTRPASDQKTMQFTVTYADNSGSGINSASLGNSNITVTGPGGFVENATLVSTTAVNGGTAAVYQISAPGGFFSNASNGSYQINLNGNSVSDNDGNICTPQMVATFAISIGAPAVSPDITGTIIAPSASVLPGSKKNSYVLTLNNSGSATLNAKVPVTVYASPTPTFDPSTAISLVTLSEKLKLSPKASKAFKLAFAAPTSIANGGYYLIAVVDPNDTINEQYKSNNTFASTAIAHFDAPEVDLAVKIISTPTTPVTETKKGTVKVTITNTSNSNIMAKGPVNLDLYMSNNDSSLTQMLIGAKEKVSLKVGASKTFTLKITSDDPSEEYLAATIVYSGSPGDDNSANNMAFSSSTVQFGD